MLTICKKNYNKKINIFDIYIYDIIFDDREFFENYDKTFDTLLLSDLPYDDKETKQICKNLEICIKKIKTVVFELSFESENLKKIIYYLHNVDIDIIQINKFNKSIVKSFNIPNTLFFNYYHGKLNNEYHIKNLQLDTEDLKHISNESNIKSKNIIFSDDSIIYSKKNINILYDILLKNEYIKKITFFNYNISDIKILINRLILIKHIKKIYMYDIDIKYQNILLMYKNDVGPIYLNNDTNEKDLNILFENIENTITLRKIYIVFENNIFNEKIIKKLINSLIINESLKKIFFSFSLTIPLEIEELILNKKNKKIFIENIEPIDKILLNKYKNDIKYSSDNEYYTKFFNGK